MENVKNLVTTVIYPDGRTTSGKAAVISEHVLKVTVNGQPVCRLVCTRNELRELVAGRLLTAGFVEKKDDIRDISFCGNESEAEVLLNRDGFSCFGEPGNGFRKLPPYDWRPEWVFSLLEEFRHGAGIHDVTGASHICILATSGKTVFKCEDIGRHNAVDKAIGYALLNGIPLSECMIYTSGRVPVDMAEKVIAAGIPVLVAKSVPTAESVKFAEEYDLTLICRAWPDRYEVFSGCDKLTGIGDGLT